MVVSRVVLLLFLVTVIASSLLVSVVNASDPHYAAAQCSDAHQDGNHRCLYEEDDDDDSDDEGHGDDDHDHEEVEDDDDFDDTYKLVNNVKVSAPIHARMETSSEFVVKGH